MPDLAMCKGETKDTVCPYKDNCYRVSVKPDEIGQVYFAVLPLNINKRECDYLIPHRDSPDTTAIWSDSTLSFTEKTIKSIELLKKKFGSPPREVK